MVTPSQPDDRRGAACESVRRDAFAALDGELQAHALLEIEAHLELCSACQERFAADAVFLRTIRQAAALDTAPQSLRDRVALALHSRASEIAPA